MSPFHSGEREVQRRAGVAEDASRVGRIIGRTLTPAVARFLARQRLAVASSVDAEGRVWASLLTGPAGFLAPAGPERLRIAAQPMAGDPLATNLAARPELGLLVFDPRTRQRMRFNGLGRRDEHGWLVQLRQAYGNCPKYIQLREREPDVPPSPAPPRVANRLDLRQRAWVETADTLFIASFHPEGGADASHRGGMPGFVRVLGPDRLAFPDYPGNAMFNTLGNLVEYPQAGLLFVDFTSGDVLQLTGRTRLEDDRGVVFAIDEARETRAASPLRFRLVEYSPANPPVSHEGPARHRTITRRRDDQAHRLR
jgi:predicted pyridoxine 5'-phosphate oxidase superfamily flavin-nucleotide-binding protein